VNEDLAPESTAPPNLAISESQVIAIDEEESDEELSSEDESSTDGYFSEDFRQFFLRERPAIQRV
jgi:hypothetical protein